MTTVVGEKGAEDDKECVNLLYLATQGMTTSQSQDVIHPNSSKSSPEHESPTEEKILETSRRQESKPEIICPRVNCPEKIVICLDVSQEMERESFRSRSGDKFSSIKLIKRALGMFLHTKHKLDNRHQFALVILRDQALWMHDFTDNPSKIITILDDFGKCFETETFEMSSLFDVVNSHVTLPTVSDPTLLPPPYTVRLLMLYGRSHCLPNVDNKESQKFLMSSPYFFIDVFYVHEPPTEENQSEMTFDQFCDLDEKGLYYIFEVSRNPTKLYDCMAQLLPHPLQRPLWRDVSYRLMPVPADAP